MAIELRSSPICPTCFQVSRAVAEATYVISLFEVGPVWVCPSCFARLDQDVDGLELTGRIVGDPEAFGRTRS